MYWTNMQYHICWLPISAIFWKTWFCKTLPTWKSFTWAITLWFRHHITFSLAHPTLVLSMKLVYCVIRLSMQCSTFKKWRALYVWIFFNQWFQLRMASKFINQFWWSLLCPLFLNSIFDFQKSQFPWL